MQRAGHQRIVSARVSSTPPSDISHPAVVTVRLLDEKSLQLESKQAVSVESRREVSNSSSEQTPLEIAVQKRIQIRLAGRVRNLVVRSRGDVIVLEGECNTYYSKQLAQHAAMGILEDEHLENAIVVALPR
jgi:hypothetical protein